MGWYLHENYSHFIPLPKTYSRAVCATCWKNAIIQLPKEQATDARVSELKIANTITQAEFEQNHQGHVLASIEVDGSWFAWKPQVFCRECSEWTEIYICTHKTGIDGYGVDKKGERSTYRDPCKDCYIIKSYGHRRCSCPIETLVQKEGPQFLSVEYSTDAKIFCHECDKFIAKKEVEAAIDFGQPESLNTDDCYEGDYIHLFHFAKHHKDLRERINIGYERGTLVRLLRKEYGKRLMRIKKKKRILEEKGGSETI